MSSSDLMITLRGHVEASLRRARITIQSVMAILRRHERDRLIVGAVVIVLFLLIVFRAEIAGIFGSAATLFSSKTDMFSPEHDTQEERKVALKDTCQRYGLVEDWDPTTFQHLLVDDERKLLYCFVPKVACTNWKSTLVYTSRLYHERQPDQAPVNVNRELTLREFGFTLLSDYTPEEVRYRVENYYKFMFVRHPLKRLLSVYLDKFTQYNQYTEYFHLKYGRQIVRRYRDSPSNLALQQGHDVEFREFVQYLIDTADSGGEFNGHWASYQDLCHPCIMDYDYVGKLETMDEDVREILPKITSEDVYFPEAAGSSLSESPDAEMLTRSFFKNITSVQLEKLRDVFTVDCDMFGYDCEHFVQDRTP